MTQLQFLPSLMRIIGGAGLYNILMVVAILLLTLLVGRIYCSVICPLGVFQDLVIWIRRKYGKVMTKLNAKRLRKGKGKKGANYLKRFGWVKEHKVLRYGILVALIGSWFVCGQMIISLLAPYSAYGRMIRGIIGIGDTNTPCALILVAVISLVVIIASAWIFGREWCNSICPVGSILSIFSRYSIWQISIDKSKCNECGRCYKNCRASCIDGKNHKIDASRCVDCFDCIDNCSGKAISLRPVWKRSGNKAVSEPTETSSDESPKDMSRRKFMISSAVIAGAALSQSKQTLAQHDKLGGLATLVDKQEPDRKGLLLPPGVKSAKDFWSKCTACQLCVSACPNGVLKPGTSLEHLLQPQLSYLEGHCRPECNACSQICPSGAILPFEKDAKLLQVIGVARVNAELCLAANGEAGCGNCARHCPVGAISMIRDEQGRRRPVVMEEQCIGCGACEHLCPSRPLSAIYVESRS